MCLISILGKGTEKYSNEVTKFIESGVSCNRDGSGFMYKRNGEKTITVKKGFFKVDALMDAIKKADLKVDDELVIHHRIGTAGKNNGANTHPFVCSSKHEEVMSEDITTKKPCLVHNGIFGGLDRFKALNPDFSDTYAFARYIMGDKALLNMFFEDNDKFQALFRHIMHGDKICILSTDRDLIKIGDFIEDNGYFHSHGGYCAHVYDRGGSSWKDAKKKDPFIGVGSNNKKHEGPPLLIEQGTRKDLKDLIKNRKNNSLNSNFSTKELVEQWFNGKKTKNRLILNSKIVPLTNENCKHFAFVKKETYEAFKNEKCDFPSYRLDCFDNTALVHYLQRILPSGQANCLAITESTTNLLTNYVFYPTPYFSEIYMCFSKIITDPNLGFGGKTLRKLNSLLEANAKKGITDMVMYGKTGEFTPLGTLQLLRDYVEEELISRREAELRVDSYSALNIID